MHDYDFDSHDEFRQHDEFDRFSHNEYPHHEYSLHEDYRRQPHDSYPRPHFDYPPPHDGYRPTHGDDFDRQRRPHPNDHFDEDNFRPEDDAARKPPGNKVALPDAKSVDLASLQFPHRREEFSIPDAPALNAVHVNRGDEDASPIAARSGLDFPDGELDFVNVAARKRNDLGLGEMAKSGGGIL